MKRKDMERATREGRVAILPEYLQEGRTVWYWRESLCDEDGCMDMVTSCCPLNHGFKLFDNVAKECARQHPVLENTDVWSVAAEFTARGVRWVINDWDPVPDDRLLAAYWPSREEALEHKPGRVM